LILTANNHDMIRTLLDKDMTLHDREAVGQRLLHFDLSGDAAAWLEQKGGNAFTGRKGKRWIAGVVEESDYLVAKHFLWLYSQRIVPEEGFTGRYLVDGNCSKGSSFMTHQIVQKESTAIVIDASCNIVEHRSQKKQYVLDEQTGAFYVTINSILDELKINETPMTYGKVSQVIRNVAAAQEPVELNFLEHHELDCDSLLTFAVKIKRIGLVTYITGLNFSSTRTLSPAVSFLKSS